MAAAYNDVEYDNENFAYIGVDKNGMINLTQPGRCVQINIKSVERYDISMPVVLWLDVFRRWTEC